MSEHLNYNGSNPLLGSVRKNSQPKIPKEPYHPFTLDSNVSSKMENDKLIPEEDQNYLESPIDNSLP